MLIGHFAPRMPQAFAPATGYQRFSHCIANGIEVLLQTDSIREVTNKLKSPEQKSVGQICNGKVAHAQQSVTCEESVFSRILGQSH